VIVSTTTAIDGRLVVEHMGVVTGEAVPGANVFRDRFPGLREIVGGRSAGYERSLREVRIGQVEAMHEHGASIVVSDLLKLLGDR
jgi:uncharacterized protein YbjQ (UPF0145 family)